MSAAPRRNGLSWATTLGFAAVAAALVGVIASFGNELGRTDLLVGFVVAQVATSYTTMFLQRKGETEVWNPESALFAAGLLLLPPTGFVLSVVVGTVTAKVLGRRRVLVICFNTVQDCIAACAAAAVIVWHPVGMPPTWADVWLVAGAAVLSTVTSESVIGVYYRLLEGEPFFAGVRRALAFSATRLPFFLGIGLIAGVAGGHDPTLAILGLGPMLGAQIAVAEHLRARGDRERLRGLLAATNDAHASIRSEDVCAAITSAATNLLRLEDAWIADTAPAGGLTVPLSTGRAERWLVLGPRLNGDTFEAEDHELLDALAKVGSSALENALLVDAIQHQAVHDPLTGLANQVLFEDRVNQTVVASRRTRERFAVMVLDIDAFKKVNDSLGHSSGNELLRLIADRLRGAVRELDTVARLGSDHFTLHFPGLDVDEASVMAEKILAAVRRPVSLGGHELFMTASAGIAFFPEDGTRPEHLLRNADGAMHRAKEMGRDTFELYASGMNEAAHMRLVRESELHQALERDELRLRYQPQVDLRTGRITGVEALVRWEHPVLGLIGPHEFVPLAEESGLVVGLDTWVLRRACAQAKQWRDEGLPPIVMAVNLSGRHFHSGERLVDTVSSVLHETELEPGALELEVTEGVAVREEDDAFGALAQVHDLGVRLAIDDFGTGYSVLGRLQHFKVDKLKIDRSFVSEIDATTGEAPIVAAMIAMGRSLGIEVVAEGVETLEQRDFLVRHGCDQVQGFLFGHPGEAAEIARLLRTPSRGLAVGKLT